MTVHPREALVSSAEMAFLKAEMQLRERHDTVLADMRHEDMVVVYCDVYIKTELCRAGQLDSRPNYDAYPDYWTGFIANLFYAWTECAVRLTPCERAAIMASRIASSAKYGIRVERHGDTDKEGGLA